MNFDIERFRELLKESILLDQEGKSLRYSNKAKYDELQDYFILLQNDTFWQSRKDYQQIINQFVSEKITFDEFEDKHARLRQSNFQTYERRKKNLKEEILTDSSKINQINLDLNTRSSEFMDILSAIYSDIDLIDHDVTLEMNLKNPELISYGMSPEFWRFYLIEKFVPKINKLCKES